MNIGSSLRNSMLSSSQRVRTTLRENEGMEKRWWKPREAAAIFFAGKQCPQQSRG
jgi:hypothetical protein